ncbi:hypothetical protein GSI_02080 [Ganoderma sinense ZZ0214-1]|uniref:Uncharacterized protein n=1 Tax=Ganoderma sinense ZZ0214-1 TaxID=1077348 RepID=A0A2G8SNK9_9APHY|nr:hypothetical protein GSI_02080 [Ganoderma sinense ZZ0214-1]
MHVYCKVSDDVSVPRCPYRSRTTPSVLRPSSSPAPEPEPEPHPTRGPRAACRAGDGRRALSPSEVAYGLVRNSRLGRLLLPRRQHPATVEGVLRPGLGRASIPSSVSPSLLYLLSHPPIVHRLPRPSPSPLRRCRLPWWIMLCLYPMPCGLPRHTRTLTLGSSAADPPCRTWPPRGWVRRGKRGARRRRMDGRKEGREMKQARKNGCKEDSCCRRCCS